MSDVDKASTTATDSALGDTIVENTLFIDLTSQNFNYTKMADTKIFHMHRFNGNSFHLWRRQMEIYMTENKLKPYVLGTTLRPEGNTSAQWDEKDAEAQAFLMRGLELEQLKYLSDCTTAAAMWSRLNTVHSEKGDQSVQALLDRFINCKMDNEEEVADHTAKIISLAQRLKDIDLEPREPVIIAMILGSLPARFDNMRTAWYAMSRGEQTLDKLTDHLVNEEILLNTRTTEIEGQRTETAYMTRNQHYGKLYGKSSNTKDKNKNKYDQFDNSNGRGNNSSHKRRGNCNFYKAYGHWARDCYKKKAQLISRNRSFVAQASTRSNSSNQNTPYLQWKM